MSVSFEQPHQTDIKKKSSTQFHIKDSESQAKNMAKNDYKKEELQKRCKMQNTLPKEAPENCKGEPKMLIVRLRQTYWRAIEELDDHGK